MQISRVALAIALAACAPVIDGPAERQRALDREDGARLAAQISALPGVVRAEAVIRRAVRDPLAPRRTWPDAPAAAPPPAPAAPAAAAPATAPAAATATPNAAPAPAPMSAPAAATASAAASIAIAIDDRADRAAITDAARTLARALAPEAAPAIVVEVAAIRPSLAKVGPFTVEAASRGPLKAALAAALALIAALAGWIGRTSLRQRRGRSVQ